MQLAEVSLDDKFLVEKGRIFLTGSQALVRLPIMQRQRDMAAGLNTACFISGYRGSPMHTVDTALWKVPDLLEQYNIRFVPGVNEDLAATAVRGSQMAGMYGDGEYDGVTGIWYGKGPGLDRSVDAIRHANLSGTSRFGGVLALCGDDHGMRSTDTPAHCEPTFEDMMMPTLYPANIQEVLDYGLLGIALSRYCGAWVGFKMVFETVDTSVSVDVDPGRVQIVEPELDMPEGGPHIRVRDWWFEQEARLKRTKIPAALAFARANGINGVTHNSPNPRYGIIAAGKAWLDTLEALRSLGITEELMSELGICIYKVGMVWPHDLDGYREFASGLEEVLVVEEKRENMERAVKDACYDLPADARPRIVGRHDERGELLIDELGELSPEHVALALAKRIQHFYSDQDLESRSCLVREVRGQLGELPATGIARLAYFCSGCPHNTSTRVPEGSRAHGGVGCHGMAMYMDRGVVDWTHMGGEGMTWVGESAYVSTDHVFQDLGDGTYFHSGMMAIRGAIAAGVNITYKILYNDAVAMTGGQPVDGSISVAEITHQVTAEGVKRIEVVTDEPEKYRGVRNMAAGVSVHHRSELSRVQEELRKTPGTSILIYDQTCAAEKRRRRKRGLHPDPAKRLFINERVCEGCGDCGAQSNCLSVLPKETEYGRKRMIDQSSCNKDYSCLEGFCPSFVTVLGGSPRKGRGVGQVPENLKELPSPAIATIARGATYAVLVTGVGGTGVVTIGALLGMAAHLEGKGVSVVDQLGMAQKGGAVMTHIRFAHKPEDIKAVRVNTAAADLLLGCDSLVGGSDAALLSLCKDKTHAIVNTNQAITGDFTRDPDLAFPAETINTRLQRMVGEDNCDFVDATYLATRLLGDSIASNLFVVGYSWQKGLLPISSEAILRAIELNGVAVDWNKEAFQWGRRAACDMGAVAAMAEPAQPVVLLESTQDLINRRSAELEQYQDSAYADRYRRLAEQAATAERERTPGQNGLATAVARYAHKLMAYKDEYEVARLYSEPAFRQQLDEQFEGDYKLQFNLAPPLIAPRDKTNGQLQKMVFGPWIMTAFKLLAKLKFLRGTRLDVFGYSEERRQEQALIARYEATVTELLAGLGPENHHLAVEIASLPEQIRGYGHVKERHLAAADKQWNALLTQWRQGELKAAA